MKKNLQSYFDMVPTLTEPEKSELICLITNNTKGCQNKLKNLLFKHYARFSKTKTTIPRPLFINISAVLNCSSILECKCKIEIMKKHRFWQRKWTMAEDQQLKALCKSKPILWQFVINKMHPTNCLHLRRQANLIKDRWYNKLNPVISNQSWEVDEDKTLIASIQRFGKQWRRIQKILQFKRTEMQIIERFYHILLSQENKENNIINYSEKTMSSIDFISLNCTQLDEYEAKLTQEYSKSLQLKRKDKQVQQQLKEQKKLKKLQQQTLNIIAEVMQAVPQDNQFNQKCIQAQCNSTADYTKKIKLNSQVLETNNLDEIQFGIRNGNSNEISIFPQQQLKAVLKMLYGKAHDQQSSQPNIRLMNAERQQQPETLIIQQVNAMNPTGTMENQLQQQQFSDFQQNRLLYNLFRQQQLQQLDLQQFFTQQSYLQYQIYNPFSISSYVQNDNQQPLLSFPNPQSQDKIAHYYQFNCDSQIKKEDLSEK